MAVSVPSRTVFAADVSSSWVVVESCFRTMVCESAYFHPPCGSSFELNIAYRLWRSVWLKLVMVGIFRYLIQGIPGMRCFTFMHKSDRAIITVGFTQSFAGLFAEILRNVLTQAGLVALMICGLAYCSQSDDNFSSWTLLLKCTMRRGKPFLGVKHRKSRHVPAHILTPDSGTFVSRHAQWIVLSKQ